MFDECTMRRNSWMDGCYCTAYFQSLAICCSFIVIAETEHDAHMHSPPVQLSRVSYKSVAPNIFDLIYIVALPCL